MTYQIDGKFVKRREMQEYIDRDHLAELEGFIEDYQIETIRVKYKDGKNITIDSD